MGHRPPAMLWAKFVKMAGCLFRVFAIFTRQKWCFSSFENKLNPFRNWYEMFFAMVKIDSVVKIF